LLGAPRAASWAVTMRTIAVAALILAALGGFFPGWGALAVVVSAIEYV
jgi:hypothetical protein